jgi:hypothetical protein
MKYPVYDKKYSETVKTDFRKPNGIMVRLENGEEVLIDGNHRMNNAYLKGKKTIKTYYIEDPKQIAKFTKKNKFELGGENKVGGHLSKNKSLKQIAEMHNVSLAHINEEIAKGLEVEKEHFADFKERTRVAKDHLVENPNYYTILAKVGLKDGGHLRHHRHSDNLVKDAKSGNTPARDLNNYNDLLDVQADGAVGGDSGIYANGGVTPYDANQEGDSVDVVEDEFAKGGVVYDTTKPTVDKITIRETKYDGGSNLYSGLRENIVGKEATNISYFINLIKDYVGQNPIEETDWISFYVNDGKRGNYYIDLNKDKKNTVKNVNPKTGGGNDIKRVIDAKTYLVKNYDWTEFFGGQRTKKDNSVIRISVSYDSKNISNSSNLKLTNNTLELYNFLRGLHIGDYENIKLQPIGNALGVDPIEVNLSTFSWDNLLMMSPQETAVKEINRILYGLFPNLNFDKFVKSEPNSNASKELDLTDTKVWIGDDPKLSEEIQKAVFSLGWTWSGRKEVKFTDAKYLIFNSGKFIGYRASGTRNDFDSNTSKELNPQDILLAKKPTITTTQSQYPEYYEFVDDTRNSFTKGKIYKVRNPKDIEAGENFIDDNGITNGFSGNNAKYFKPSTEQAFLAQQSGTSASAKSFDFTDTKIDVKNNPALSIRVQKQAFENGWEWESGKGKNIDLDPFNYLYFTKKSISEGSGISSFNNSPKREITEEEIFGGQKNVLAQTQYPEYYEFIENFFSNSFTKGKIYKIKNPKDLHASNNFVNDSGLPDGYGTLNDKYFKPSTEEAFLAQQNDDKITKFNVVVENSSYPDIEVNNVLELFSALQTRVGWDSTILLKYKTPKGESKKFGLYFRNNPDEYYELKRENGKLDFDVNYLSNKVKEWFPNEVSDKFFKNALTTSNIDKEITSVDLSYEVNGNPTYYSGLTTGKDFIEAINNVEQYNPNQDVEVRFSFNYKEQNITGGFSRESSVRYFTFGKGAFKPSNWTVSEIKSIVQDDWLDNEYDFDKFFSDIVSVGSTKGSNLAPYEASKVILEWKNKLGILVYRIFITENLLSGQEFIDELKSIEKELGVNDVEVKITAYAKDSKGNEFDRITEFTIGENWFQPSTRTNEQIKSIVENEWIDGINFDKFFQEAQTPTSNSVVPKTANDEKFTDFKEVVGKLEGFASKASEKYNTKKYEESLELLNEVKDDYALALSFTPESSFMYERIELMKKIAEVQKEITRITELKSGGAYYILSKVIERLEKGEDWKESGRGEIVTNEVPQQEIDSVIHTEKFKNWFGNWEKALITKEYDYVSKAITEIGKPCVMYHGAKRIKFSYRQVSNGVLYLAENRSYAEWFSANESPYQKQGDYLTQCFVNIKNPIDLTPLGVEELDLRDIIQFIDSSYPLAKIYDVLDPRISMAIMNNNLIGLNVRAWNIIRQYPEFNSHIRDNTTYDGFIYYENNPSDKIINEITGELEDKVTKATAVFNSNQVKLVDAMLFDSSLDDWRFETGGKVN